MTEDSLWDGKPLKEMTKKELIAIIIAMDEKLQELIKPKKRAPIIIHP